MIVWELAIALTVALLLVLLFGSTLRSRRVARYGGWPLFFAVFAILLLASWAGGLWLAPFGPIWRGVYWVPFLVVGLTVLLILFALLPVQRPPTPPSGPGPRPAATERVPARPAAGVALGIFFWVTLAVLLAAILARHRWY